LLGEIPINKIPKTTIATQVNPKGICCAGESNQLPKKKAENNVVAKN
jgi:hypothetical protein